MKQSSGFSLIEILISFLLLSMILLGLDAIQIYTLRKAHSVYFLSLATIQLNNLSERLQASNGRDLNSLWVSWNKENQAILPQGTGMIQGNFPHYVATIFWGTRFQTVCQPYLKGKSGCLKISVTL